MRQNAAALTFRLSGYLCQTFYVDSQTPMSSVSRVLADSSDLHTSVV